MLIARIDPATRVMNAPSDWDGTDMQCGALPILDVMTSEGAFMVSAWEPTPDEIKQLLAGATIKLWIRGTAHPVVALTVGDIALEIKA
jgi:hypothetical protein